jgi:hypothetical protein
VSIAKIVGSSLPPFTALSRQGGYAHILKGYFYTNLGGTLYGTRSITVHLLSEAREGSLQRKLIWIQPYKTAGLDT